MGPHSHSRRGQSLIELVVGIGIGVLFITAAIGIITVSLRLDFQNKFSQTAAELNQQMIENVITFANADWHNVNREVRLLPLSLTPAGGFLSLTQASSSNEIGGSTYETSFMIEDVCRNSQDQFTDCPAGTTDPSTLKITAATQWQQSGSAPELRLVHYLTRIRDRIWLQSDWTNGSSSWSGSPFTLSTMNQGWFSNATNTQWTTSGQLTIFDKTKNLINTGGNGISPTLRYAWNDVVGWFDFRTTNTVTIGSTITGYARSVSATVGMYPIGDLALDCATPPSGASLCGSPSTWSVVKDTSGTSAGILSGFAWNDVIGWVSFNCSDTSSCATSAPCPTSNPAPTCLLSGTGSGGKDYNVRIDSQGNFFGYAWNDSVGWLSFNCDHSQDSVPGTNFCTTGGTGVSADYQVKTGPSQVSWAELESIPFDTERNEGAGYNTIMWQGTPANDTRVFFQIATSNNSTGPWTYIGPEGTSLMSDVYQPTGPNVPLRISRANHNNQRYMAYRVILESDPAQSVSPTITDIILNWSH